MTEFEQHLKVRGLRRLPNWEQRLTEWLLELYRWTQAGSCTFDWDPSKRDQGHWNCLTFAGSATEMLLGVNLYDELAGDEVYDSPLAALKILQRWEASSIPELLGKFFPEVPKHFAHHGDLVMIPSRDAPDFQPFAFATAIAEPPYLWTITSEGLARAPLSLGSIAFSVGWGA